MDDDSVAIENFVLRITRVYIQPFRVKELQSGKGGRGGGQEVVMAELPPVDALPAAQDDSDELEYIEVHWAHVDLYGHYL